MKQQAQTASLAQHPLKPYKARKGEGYMNTRQREYFRKILENWKGQLLSDADRTMHSIQNETSRFSDDVDQANQEEGFSIELRTRDRELKLIQKIDHTIALINTGTYGRCKTCGVEIGIRRLEARPTATLCIDCKTTEERREQHLRD